MHSNILSAATSSRPFSSWNQRGYDLTFESSLPMSQHNAGEKPLPPLVVVHTYSDTGFDVSNTLKNVTPSEDDDFTGEIHMHGSIVAFGRGCFLWNVTRGHEITLESLAPVFLHRPKIECLFVGCNDETILDLEWKRIQDAAVQANIVVNKSKLTSAIGTFNLLNAEGRSVAAALIMPKENEI
jgi:uncharacterized protein